MLFLFGKGKKYIRKEGGKSEMRHCPNCKQTTTFYEAVPAEYIHVFFIPIYTDTEETKNAQALFQCAKCEATYTVTGSGITLNAALGFLKRFFSFIIDLFYSLLRLFTESQFVKERKAKKKEQHIQNELNKLKKKVKNEG